MERQRDIRVRHQQPAGHSKVHDPLNFFGRVVPRTGGQVKNDMFADTANPLDCSAGQHLGHLCWWCFEGLRFLTEPGAGDSLAVDALMHATGDSFYFWQFRHTFIDCLKCGPGAWPSQEMRNGVHKKTPFLDPACGLRLKECGRP